MAEGEPKTVQILNNKLPHTVESVVRRFHDFHEFLDSLKESFNVFEADIQIDFAAKSSASLATGIEHQLTVFEL